ncbi:hypothetical protein [Hymenobacter negativus]|uniref:PKD domain-containing protein n=1 Tax=Hymenobacter negativus TaxID=2795026 RepID=A0ABS3QKE9_9BACT|nr:hypothetical protein [Hymenobacter negativus]MBO2011556.1 hypothetical protein [Hymenobacter negativus]
MQALQDNYPVFEANQVLTNAHLNQVFDYLDEQERLTRANLIGIGIVCGLEIRLETTAGVSTIHLSHGCGVTSAGYLILEPEDVDLVAYRDNYTVPPEPGYAPFLDPITHAQYPLWELFPAGEPNVKPLATPANFLQDKAVLLFLELKKEDLRNCSPINCDDKGASVTVTVRRLLVTLSDLAKIIAAANQLVPNLTGADLETALLARLNLPDLRLPRFDVPNTKPITSGEVLTGFHAAFYENKLVQNTAAALTAAYTAFRPVVEMLYATNPFAGFTASFGFLDAAPTTTAQVRFLQYYYDFFGDLLQAYDEFRWKGAELLCACCPDEDLFPRHLMLGALVPTAITNPGIYRQRFLGSAAVSGCEEQTQELRQLFRRLVEMVERFTNTPPLTPANASTEQIRCVPSKLADVPLSDKAIPYYYLQTGTTPLFQLWNPLKTRRNRANQNLSYRAAEYQPTPPPFVTNPLRYDLEPYNFLRVEGHLGKNYQSALGILLALKERNRLPIDIIALRTGAFDEKMTVDLTKESAHFQDLESLYDTLREEIMTALAEGARFFYGVMMPKGVDPAGVAKLPLLAKYAPGLPYQRGSVGAWFEKNLTTLLGLPYIDVDQTRVSDNTIWTVFCLLFQHAAAPQPEFYPHVVAIYYFEKLAEILPPSLSAVGFDDLENKYEDLLALARYFRSEAAANFPADLAKFLPQEDLIDQFDEVLYSAKLGALRALRDEYKRRLRELKQQQFLGYFLNKHPGIQHKAGVPMGGTFILVYHDDPDPVLSLGASTGFNTALLGANINLTNVSTAAVGTANALTTQSLGKRVGQSISEPDQPRLGQLRQLSDNELPAAAINTEAMSAALGRISANEELSADPDVRLLLSRLTGSAPDRRTKLPGKGGVSASKIIQQTVDELADGTIIADFYLPYLVSSGGGVQFVLPKPPPTFMVTIGCTNADQQAEITLAPEGGMPPYSYKTDEAEFQPLKGSFLLSAGEHRVVVRDAEASESAPQTVKVTGQLAFGEASFECFGDNNEYVLTAQITGGTAPYTASRGSVTGNQYMSDLLPGNEDVEITISDSQQCSTTQSFSHSCLPPLAFTTQVGCTSDKEAQVQILPTGGTAPYQVRVDSTNGRFVALDGPLTMAVGTHTVFVRDAAGVVAPAQSVVVGPPLRLRTTGFECEELATYKATIVISGGQLPYLFNGQPLSGNELTTEPVASGQPVRVEVTDANNCTAELEVTHTCEEPCNLPCEGKSRRCAYRLWVQPPVKGNEYEAYDTANSRVVLRYNGKEFGLPGSVIAMPTSGLNGDFANTVGGMIEQLNKAIAGEIGDGLIMLSYQPDEKDPFALLWIEHFVCETFSLSFDYLTATPQPLLPMNVEYTNEPDPSGAPFDGATFIDRRARNPRTQVPAFNCSERDQCAHTKFEPLCKGTMPRAGITVDFPRFTGSVSGVTASNIVAWIWEFTTAQPGGTFFPGQIVTPSLSRDGRVRLTVITNRGCFDVAETDYKVGKV